VVRALLLPPENGGTYRNGEASDSASTDRLPASTPHY